MYFSLYHYLNTKKQTMNRIKTILLASMASVMVAQAGNEIVAYIIGKISAFINMQLLTTK